MADNPATGTQRARGGAGAGQVLVAEPGESTATNPLLAQDVRAEDLIAGDLRTEDLVAGDLRTEDLVAGDLLVETVSIDGMCGVY